MTKIMGWGKESTYLLKRCILLWNKQNQPHFFTSVMEFFTLDSVNEQMTLSSEMASH